MSAKPDLQADHPLVSDMAMLRDEFPALHQQVNGHPLAYLDNAASAQCPRSVIDAVKEHRQRNHSNVHRGVHELSERSTRAYEASRAKTKEFLNAAQSEEIVFTSGTTGSINLVASSLGGSLLNPGDEVLISEMEHHSNIVPWQLICEKTGAKLIAAPITPAGEIDLEQFEALLSARTKIFAITHVSNALGTVNPVKDMISLARQVEAIVLVDGAQAVPHMPVDVQALDCDFYAFSSHKMFGPTGVGVLYGKRELLETMPPYQGGGEMISTVSFERSTYNAVPYKFEAGTPNITGVIGFGAALDFLNRLDWKAIARHERELLRYATDAISSVPGCEIIGNAEHKAGVISFVLDGIHAHDIGTIVDQYGIAIRTGHHCAMPVMDRFGIAATARASFAFYNNRDDVDQLIGGIDKAMELFA